MKAQSSFLLTASICLALPWSVSAQDGRKVAAPLPWADLDSKTWTPAPQPAPTTPKVGARPALRSAPQAEPLKIQESVALPGGGGFSFGQARELLFDATSGGAIWADAGTYKASFSASGFTFIPYFGSGAPQNYPVTFSLESAQLGTAETPRFRAAPQHQGRAVVLERGALQERYELSLEGVEQKFVVRSPFAGDLVITLRVSTELEAARDDAGLRFSNELGHVGYTNAVLVDASGQRSAMQTEYEHGVITLRADAATLSNAVFPVTVDPLVTAYLVGTDTTYVRTNVDIAFRNEPGNTPGHYLVVWTRIYSAADTDLHAVSVDASGALVAASSSLIDNSSDRWDDGRVASCGPNFLAVASRQPAGGGERAIWGRIRTASSPYSMGSQFQISGPESGDKVSPDVGGEWDAPANFCVVWQRNFHPIDHDLQYRIVFNTGAMSGGVGALDYTLADDFRPRISKSTGAQPVGGQYWQVVWQRLVGGTQHDIIGRRIAYDGLIFDPSFNIDTAPGDDDTQPSVSTVTDDIGARFFLVSYTTNNGGNLDIYLRAYQDGSVPLHLSSGFLANQENLGSSERARDQFQSQTDSDGGRFAVSYLERYSATDRDAYITTLDLAPSLRAIDPRVTLSYSSLDTHSASHVANRSGGGLPLLYGAVWDLNSSSGTVDSSVLGAIYRGARPGAGFVPRATACGPLTITTANGAPIPGPNTTIRYDLAGAAGPTFFMIGLPTPAVPMCPPASCALGTSMIVVASGSTFVATIPSAPFLVDSVVAVQGAAVATPGGCASIGQLVVSDTIDTTIR